VTVRRQRQRWSELSPWARAAVVVLSAVEIGLAAAAWIDLARRPAAEVRGAKRWWAPVILVNFAGPIAYFRWGRRRTG
jgi:hypothetical protein